MRKLLLMAAIPVLSHCIKTKPVADVFHKSETFVNGTFSWQWAVPNNEQRYLSALGVSGQPSEAVRRVEAHLQGRLETMVAHAKAQRPEMLAAVPVPRIVIVDNGVVNAWVKPVMSCIPLNINLSMTTPVGVGAPVAVHLTYDLSGRVLTLSSTTNCSATAAAPNMGMFVQWWNSKRIACKFSEMSGAIVPQTNCFSEADSSILREKGIARATALQMPVAAPYIFVGSGMLHEAANEAQVLGVVAHELTHYLMSHFTNEDSNKYDYFYDDKTHTVDDYPKPDANLAVLGAELRGFEQEIDFARVEGQRFHSATFRANVDFAASLRPQSLCGTNVNCITACSELERFSKSPEFARLSEIPPVILNAPPRFPFAPLEAELVLPFRLFETHVERCSSVVDLSRADHQNGPLFRNALLGVLSHEKREAAATELNLANSRLDLLRLVSSLEVRSDERKRTLYARLMELRGGWYTVEQEADDMGLELLVMMGGSVEDMIAFKLAFGGAKKGSDDYDVSPDSCRKWRGDGWMTNGRPVLLPLGAMSDNHHSACYRVFNLDREQRIHGYKPAVSKLLDAAAWRDFIHGTVLSR